MKIFEEIKILCSKGILCSNCYNKLSPVNNKLRCVKCRSYYVQNQKGVWDFSSKQQTIKTPKFYNHPDLKNWKKIFAKFEINDWVIYKTALRRFFSQAGHRKINKELSKINDKTETVLEIGAGTGALLKNFPKLTYIGLDHSIESLNELKEKHPNAIAVCISGTKIPFSNNGFKNICSLHTLEHIYDIAEHLEEVARLLKRKGIYHYVIPTEGGLAFWLGRQLITGPHLKKKYNLNVNHIMEREHINDAKRVLKFLDFYFTNNNRNFWPLSIPIMSINVMINGKCHKIN